MNLPKREQTEGFKKELKIGFSQVEVLAICPSVDQIAKMREVDVESIKEQVYTSEKSDNEGNAWERLNIPVYVKNQDTGNIDIMYFSIDDKVQTSKDGKIQYINCVGQSQWVHDEKDLWDSFKSFTKYEKGVSPKDFEVLAPKTYRAALVGEEKIYKFLMAWSNADMYNRETNVLIDTKKLFKENFKQLQELTRLDLGTVIVPYSVVTRDKDGELVQSQRIDSSFILPGAYMKTLRLSTFDREKVDKLKQKKLNKESLTFLERFIVECCADEYGIQGYFEPCTLKDYDAEQDPLATSNPIVGETSDTPY